MGLLQTIKETECTCHDCKMMCKQQVCFPTPDDVIKLVEAGYGEKLHLSVVAHYRSQLEAVIAIGKFGSDFSKINLVPVIIQQRKKENGSCIFLDENELCQLHNLGLKPTEGKLAIHNDFNSNLRYEIEELWLQPENKHVLTNFEKNFPNNISVSLSAYVNTDPIN